ncbi:hypothetical protein RX327_11285 [Bradyrhizobium sp. BEA-2-5]|uniref:hypothetical protein n=1 Tax=Bradyrhizobium TaxID=374 RepID=UPI00067C2C06|nr:MULTISPECIES: hypothetical protein [Bradyrhizobium]WOH83659.1 hypothetical protein RX327_11285 [Bradyrhizobium sp. BEA-2-5]
MQFSVVGDGTGQPGATASLRPRSAIWRYIDSRVVANATLSGAQILRRSGRSISARHRNCDRRGDSRRGFPLKEGQPITKQQLKPHGGRG